MPSLLCTLMAPIAVFAVGMGPQVDRPDAEVPTAIERALMERACVATETVSAESYGHQHCLDAKLLSLRSDFGRDLSRLSAPDRRRIDAACSRLRASDQREAYLDCLSAQLTVVHNRQNRGKTPTPEEAVVAVCGDTGVRGWRRVSKRRGHLPGASSRSSAAPPLAC